MFVCCVPGCEDKDSIRHRFPSNDSNPNAYQVWIQRIGNPTLLGLDSKIVRKNYRICTIHFDDSCRAPGTVRLKFGSLPTKYLPSFKADSQRDSNLRTLTGVRDAVHVESILLPGGSNSTIEIVKVLESYVLNAKPDFSMGDSATKVGSELPGPSAEIITPIKASVTQLPFSDSADSYEDVEVMTPIKTSVNVKKLTELDKYCFIMFDEISLGCGVTYDSKEDRIVGFEDYGENSDKKFADRALVFMLRGLRKAWKQPIAYFFCENAIRSDQLAILIRRVIAAVQATGLKVVASVCDQAANNVGAINRLLKETSSACKRRGEKNRFVGYNVGGEEVVPIYDPPHLLKGIRNNLLTSDVKFKWKLDDEQIASWDDLEKFYATDVGDDYTRMCSRLTDRHVVKDKIEKTDVLYAAQVFSHQVSSVLRGLVMHGSKMIPPSAANTADFFIFMDLLFDSVNGTSLEDPTRVKSLRTAITSTSPHISFWATATKVLKSMTFFNNKTQVPLSVKNWLFTINNLKYLWRKLSKCGFFSLKLGLINQDPLENFFSSIRSLSYSNTNPTPYSFIRSYKTLIRNNFMTTQSTEPNCKEDISEGALDSSSFFLVPSEEDNFTPILIELEDITYESKLAPIILEKHISIAGYIASQLLKKNNCKNCRISLVSSTHGDECCSIKEEDITDRLLDPHSNFSSLFCQIVHYFGILLPRVVFTRNIFATLQQYFQGKISYENTCEAHDSKIELINYSIKILMESWTTDVNSILQGKMTSQFDQSPLEIDDEIKKAALVKFKKLQLQKMLKMFKE